MLGLSVLGVACAWSVNEFGAGLAPGRAAAAVGVGSVAGFAPALLRIGAAHWGLSVVLAGVARALLVLLATYSMQTNMPDLAQTGFYRGIIAGAVLILIGETALSIGILSKIEAHRARLKHQHGTPGSTRGAGEHA